ncbi:MAG: glycosyltransferase [Sphingomonas sp.]
MRIVDVNEYYSPTGGGVRTYLERKMAILGAMGHELIVIAPGDEDSEEERPGGGRLITVKSPRLVFDHNYWLFWNGAPVLEWLDRLQPDVVETSSPWRPAWFVGNWQGDAVKVFFMHNDNVAAYPQRWLEGVASPPQVERLFAWYSHYMNRFLAKFDAVVTNGPALEKRHRQRGVRVDASMPLGIDRGYFSPELRDEGLRAALLAQCHLPPEGHLLLGLGRHHPEKRWPMVIDAVQRAGHDRPVGLILLGDGVERRAILRRIADSPHIRTFRPLYDRMQFARIVASCDALIHGSEVEPFGLVASEAMAAGLPLIAPNEGGCAEIADPLCSELYEPRSAAAAAAAIIRMVDRDRRLLRRTATIAAARVRSDQEHAADLVAYYAELIARRRSGITRVA